MYDSTSPTVGTPAQGTVADGISRTDEGAPVTRGAPAPAADDTSWSDGAKDDRNGSGAGAGFDAHLPSPDLPTLRQSHEGEHHGDHGEVFALTRSVYLFAGCAALNSCNLGYDIGVNTDAAMKLQNSMYLTDVQIEIFMGSLNLFAMLGALGSHFVSDRLGRRGAFLVSAVGFIIGVLIQCTAPNYTALMFGRVFVGLGVGFGLAVDPVYISEISPAAHRGMLVTWSEIATNVGILLGFMSGLFFYNVPDGTAWRGMFALGIIMPSILIILVCTVMPESPRWLVQKQREHEAIEVLQKIYPPGYDVSAVADDIKDNIRKDTEAEHAVGWDVILFPSPAFKRMLIVGICTAIAQQAVGIDAIQYFLVFILDESGIKNEARRTGILIFLGLVKVAMIVVAGRLFDRKGRRPLLFISCGGMCLALFMLSINFYASNTSGGFAAFALALYLAFFSLGMGPGCWLIPSEVFATTIRAKAMSVATFMNRVTATLMSSTFLSTANAMSYSGFFLLLAIVCLLVGAFFYLLLPETKGRSLEDMSTYFAEITGDRSVLELEESLSRRLAEERAVATAAPAGSSLNAPHASEKPKNVEATTVGTMA